MSDRKDGKEGSYTEPATDLRFSGFVASLIGKLTEYQKAKELE